MSGRHSFSFRCRDTFEEFPRYEPIEREQLRSAAALVAGRSVFYADRVSPTILEAMEVAHSAGAIVYFEPSDLDGDLFDDALRSEERRVGEECVSTGRTRGAEVH